MRLGTVGFYRTRLVFFFSFFSVSRPYVLTFFSFFFFLSRLNDWKQIGLLIRIAIANSYIHVSITTRKTVINLKGRSAMFIGTKMIKPRQEDVLPSA